jgi:hypothetical protein
MCPQMIIDGPEQTDHSSRAQHGGSSSCGALAKEENQMRMMKMIGLAIPTVTAISLGCSSANEPSPSPAQGATSNSASAEAAVTQWLSGPEASVRVTKGPTGTSYLATVPLSQGVLTMELVPQSSSDISGELVSINPGAFHDFYAFQNGELQLVSTSGLANAVVAPERSLCGAYNVQGLTSIGLADGTTSADAMVRIAYSADGDTATPYAGYCGVGSDGICRVNSSCSIYLPNQPPAVGSCQMSRFGLFEWICYCGSGGSR